jgi:hypothetical protein
MRHDNCLPASLPSVGSDLGQILRTIQNVHLLQLDSAHAI